MVYLKLVLTMALWGGTFIAAQGVGQSLLPYAAAFCRFVVAAIGMGILLWSQGESLPRLKPHQVLPVVLLGMTGVLLYNLCFFSGLRLISTSRAGLIIALNPVCITVCGAIAFRQQLRPLSLGGIALALVGVTLILSNGDLAGLVAEGIGLGDWWLLGCVVSWSVYSLIGKQLMATLSPLVTATYAIWVGAIALFPLALHQGLWQAIPTVPLAGWLGVLYLGVMGTVLAFSWYYEGIQTLGTSQASIFMNLVPVFAVLFGVVLLQEPLSLAMVLGGGLVGLGVLGVNRPQES